CHGDRGHRPAAYTSRLPKNFVEPVEDARRIRIHQAMRIFLRVLLALFASVFLASRLAAVQSAPGIPVADQFNNLHFRSIGPAVMSGRFSDIAVFEKNPKIFYLASSHSGLWKTINDGVTFVAQFQDQGLMSIGDVTMSQTNPDVVWIG